MHQNIGRNELCPCGSGNKHKKCCANQELQIDFAWHQLRQTEGRLVDRHLKEFVMNKLPEKVLETALDDFFPEDLPEKMDQETLFNNFFIPWFLFNWIPLDDFEVDQFNPDFTISMNYLKKHGYQLNGVEKCFIETMNQTYYSYYSVLEVEFEKSITVKDILLGTTHTLKERQATHSLKRGDIVFSRILTMDKQSIFIGMAPYVIPAHYQIELINFKNWLMQENDNQILTPQALREELDIELFEYFFETMQEIFNPRMPTLCNTDGELIEFTTSSFELKISSEEALKKIWHLSLENNYDDFLKCIDEGDSEKIEFPWLKKGNKKHKDQDNTVLGHITINDNKLILETNSQKRAEKGKKLLFKYLGKSIHFEQMLIESQEQKRKLLSETSETDEPSSDLLESPEVQEQIKRMASNHWKNWFDEPIPMLNNQTPREAAKTEAGRELLEALLLQYERHDLDRDGTSCYFKADINYLKKELGLS